MEVDRMVEFHAMWATDHFWVSRRVGYVCCLLLNDAVPFIYNLINDCTVISNTIITNNMLLHVSTFKMSSSGSSLCLAKTTYRFCGLSKIKLLKYKR